MWPWATAAESGAWRLVPGTSSRSPREETDPDPPFPPALVRSTVLRAQQVFRTSCLLMRRGTGPRGAVGPVIPLQGSVMAHGGLRAGRGGRGRGGQPGLPVGSQSVSSLSDSRWAACAFENHYMAVVRKREMAHMK